MKRTNLRDMLSELGGISTTAALVAAGATRRRIVDAARDGEIRRIRRGWYATTTARNDAVRAVRVGGALTCVSAAEALGIWRPPGRSLHVGVVHGSTNLKHPDTGQPIASARSIGDLTLHWSVHWSRTGNGIASIVEVLVTSVHCEPEEFAFAMIESALRKKLVTRQQLFGFGARMTALVQIARDDADSGTESVFRIRMLRLGVQMRSQVVIPGVGRVDFVIGDRLVIEIDSEAHHGGADHRLRDYDRDITLAALDYARIRIDYVQVIGDWDSVAAVIMSMVDRGDQLWR